eukprot:GHVU01178698.1.p1 GENE.GHVU01178698.1~~GHVU01178698.1.p1  ORF type:complete len:150 (+),score=18.04 GHVU01178698.1:1428-1877(+)
MYVLAPGAATTTDSQWEVSDLLHRFILEKAPRCTRKELVEEIVGLGARRPTVEEETELALRLNEEDAPTMWCFICAGEQKPPGVRHKDSKTGVEWVTHGAYRTYILLRREEAAAADSASTAGPRINYAGAHVSASWHFLDPRRSMSQSR